MVHTTTTLKLLEGGGSMAFHFYHKNLIMLYIFPIEYATPEYDELIRLRYDVLRLPLGLEFSVEQLEQEYAYHHFGAYNAGYELLGAMMLVPDSTHKSVARMKQVAVRADRERTGIGSQMVRYFEKFAKTNGYEMVELHARSTAAPFYQKLGYEIIGEPFEEVNIPHVSMRKSLKE